jgi:Domain of unknown function (DUF4258)
MTPTAALSEIRRYAIQGRIRFSGHAMKRMGERGATREDVRHALCVAKRCRASPDAPGRWEVPSVDEDGDNLVVVVVIESGVVVVSLFG